MSAQRRPYSQQHRSSPAAGGLSTGALVGILAAGAVVVGGIVYWATSDKSKPTKTRKQKIEGAAAGSPTKAKAAAVVPAVQRKIVTAAEVSDDEIIQRARTSLPRIEKTQEITKADKQLYETLLSIDPRERKGETRLVAAQWLLMYQTFDFMKDVKSLKQLKQKQKEAINDTLHMWNLLDFESAKDQVAIDMLCIDIATRLKDPVKLSNTFDRLVAREPGPHERIVIFSMAPLLGRWGTFVDVANKLIEEKADILNHFHQAAIENSQANEVADYKVLYDLAKVYKQGGEVQVPVGELLWGSYEFVEGRQLLLSAQSSDAETQESLAEEVAKGQAAGFEDFEEFTGDVKGLEFTGAIAHMTSFTPNMPIPLVGKAGKNFLSLHGYADLQDEAETGSMTVTETFELRKSAKKGDTYEDDEGHEVSLWTGSQSSKHTGPNGEVLLEINMKCEYKLRRVG